MQIKQRGPNSSDGTRRTDEPRAVEGQPQTTTDVGVGGNEGFERLGIVRMPRIAETVRAAAARAATPPPKPALQQQLESAVRAVKKAVLAGARAFGNVLAAVFGGEPSSDLHLDGVRSTAIPSDGAPYPTDAPTLIYVNGAGANYHESLEKAEYVADLLGREVTLIHNATEVRQYDNPIAQFGAMLADMQKDADQVVDDHFGRGTNPAVDAVREEVLLALRSGDPIHLVGTSQGNQIIARALKEARDIRYQELLDIHGDPATAQQQLEAEFAGVHVANVFGPVKRADYPDELTHYMHAESPTDQVPRQLGEGSDEYRDQEYLLRAETLLLDLALHPFGHSMKAVFRNPGKLDAFRDFFAAQSA